MRILTRRIPLNFLSSFLVSAVLLQGCGDLRTGQAQTEPAPSVVLSATLQPTAQVTPTPFALGPLIESDLDLRDDPVPLPLELQIPSLDIDTPIIGVGLSADNVMDAPKGPISDPIWNTAFWYRGGGVPGDIGTAAIAGHVNDPLSRPMIFAHLGELQPGDLIIIQLKNTTMDIRFLVDEVKLYSVKESADPAILTRIFGAGPVSGTAPEPSPDGLSHLTLITCAGDIINGEFNQHTVVFATRSDAVQ